MDPLKILVWNPGSLKNKTTELSHYLRTHKIDIALIAKTWLDHRDNPHINNYTLIRKDRNVTGGGVAIYVHQNIPYENVTQPTLQSIEAVTVRIKTRPSFIVGTVYSPPPLLN